MIRAVVFDFDGVLADSEPLHLAAYQEVFSSLGVELTRVDYYDSYLGYDDEGVFRKLAATHGWRLDDTRLAALIAEKSRVFEHALSRTDVLYDGAARCIERLAEGFPLGIASGAFRHEIERILERARLRHYFRFIVAAGDTPAGKPSPDPYVRAAELHGAAPSSCLAIEDSRWGIESAKAAGLKCIGLATTYPASELTGADCIIQALDELDTQMLESL
jgi:beta-phosphoglucomutase